MDNLKIKLKHRLITRLLLTSIFLAAIPIIVAGILLIRTAQKSIETTVFHRNQEYAKKAAQTISSEILSAQTILKFNAENIYNFNLNRVTREVMLNSMLTEFDIFNELYVLDVTGTIQLSTHYFADKNKFSNRNFSETVNSGEPYFSEIFISDNKLPYIEIAEPIYFLGEIRGILFARVDLKVMWDIVDNLVIGAQGEAFIVDKLGIYIAHSKRIQVYLKNRFEKRELLSSALTGHFGYTLYHNTSGDEILAAFASVDMTQWSVVIQQPTREAFAQVRIMKLQIFLLVISSIIIASLIAFLYTRRILRPISDLIAGIQRFSVGDLDYQIIATGKDEIATLIEHFNEMAIKLKQFQQTLKRTERFETLSKMAAILSHEIKNPLNAMVINMQILKKELTRELLNRDRIFHYHKIVLSEINRVDKLVNNFLLLTRPQKFKKKPIAIQSIIEEIIEEQRENTQYQHVHVVQNIHIKPIMVTADSSSLKQAFLNIYINAIEAMNYGGTLTITLTPQNYANFVENESVKIQFRDTGPGIDVSKLDKIFDFYYTTKPDGTGLGLAISQQIVEDHGGTIDVKNNSSGGATFSVTIPALSE